MDLQGDSSLFLIELPEHLCGNEKLKSVKDSLVEISLLLMISLKFLIMGKGQIFLGSKDVGFLGWKFS